MSKVRVDRKFKQRIASIGMSAIHSGIWSFRATSTVSVAGGIIERPSAAQEEEAFHKGVKLILLLSGSLECRLPTSERVRIIGPCLCATLSDGDHVALQVFDPLEVVRYVSVSFDHETGAMLFGADGDRLANAAGVRLGGSFPHLIRRPIGTALASLGRQMLTSPLRAEAASLYMVGKGLELGGLAAEALVDEPFGHRNRKLSSSDVERLHEARRILLSSLSEPPNAASLSRQVGLNVRKLTGGFKTLFGMTPSSLSQIARLDAAHQMITTGEWSIAQAAWHVGYTPAAFSTAFRRRFGMPPSHLRS